LPTVAAAPGGTPFRNVLPLRPEMGVVHPGEELPDAMRDLPYAKTIYLTFGTAFNVPQLLIQVVDAVRDLRHNVIVTTVQALIRRSSLQCRLILRLPLSCRRR
jgi:UDP:flavonoid glycosyltransferase YjiC (YdhE family)